MITPAYSLTATEYVLPKVALDFTTASLDSRITFTRTTGASNPATYVNVSGYVTSATNDQPRFDYGPITHVCNGLLIEESRQNVLKYSQDISNVATGSWGLVGSATIGATNILAPDNTNTGVTVTKTTTNSGVYTNYTITGVVSTTYTASCFIKAGTSNSARLRLNANASTTTIGEYQINLTDGSLTTVVAGVNATSTNYGNGWWRITVTGTATATALRVYILPGTAAETTTTATFWGAQLEIGAFATSYIPTTSAALTRNADVATMTGTNFSNWWTSTTGAVSAWVIPEAITGTNPIIQFDDTTANNIINLRGNVANPELYIKATTDQAQIDTGTIVANTAYKLTGAWNTNNCAAAQNGADAVTDNSATIPTVTQARIGSDGTNYANARIQKIMYWPQRLTNNEVQAFSK